MSAAELSPIRHRLDNANVSYLFQDWQNVSFHVLEVFDYALWYVSLYVAVLAGTFIYSVWCEVFSKSFVFCHFFFLFNSIATQARCDARYADLYISFFLIFFYFLFFSFLRLFQLVPWAGDLCTIEFWVRVESFKLLFFVIISFFLVD